MSVFNNEKIRQLQEAREHIEEAIYLIEDALLGTQQETHAKAYIIPQLYTWIGEGNPHDHSIPDYIEDLKEEFGLEN